MANSLRELGLSLKYDVSCGKKVYVIFPFFPTHVSFKRVKFCSFVVHFFSMACRTKTCVPLKTSGEKWEAAALESEDPYEYWIMVITVAAIMIQNTLSTNVLIG